MGAKGNKARLIPIAILMDGKFYDAGSYKAAPVPLSLDFGVVYEGFRAGVSQGIFTITQPGQLNHNWIAEGTWYPAGTTPPWKKKKYSTPVIADDDKDAPPVLHRRSETTEPDSGGKSEAGGKDKGQDEGKDATADGGQKASPPAAAKDAPAGSAPNTDAAKTTKDGETAKTQSETAKAAQPASAPLPAEAADEPVADPNRPRLRRGKTDANAHRDVYATFDELPEATAGGAGTAIPANGKGATAAGEAPPQFTFIPAISDAGGPEARPYAFDVKPAEEAAYRNKMLALAAKQMRATESAGGKELPASRKSSSGSPLGKGTGKSAGKPATPAFDSVRLFLFDLSNSNEPVLVLSAKTRTAAAGTAGSAEPKEITLVARTNLEGEVQKLFFSETDARHLDVTPRMELIDAVDADGDGRGELLFRRTFDGGSAYAIYRVTADGLWPLFEGTP